MSVKEVHHKGLGRKVKLGRRRPVAPGPQLRLKNYLTRRLAPPPASCDWSGAARSSLAQIYDNDTLGDCVVAGMAHVVGTMTGGAGAEFIYTEAQIISLYSAIGGYVPGDPATDNGCDEVTALNYWQDQGAPAGSHQIAGWLAIDPADPVEYRTALYLFENLVFGMELPNAWLDGPPSPSGKLLWDVAGNPDPANGHCVAGVGYDTKGVTISTWGTLGTITDAAIAAYATASAGGGLYAVVSRDALNNVTGLAENGLDWSQLAADFDAIGGNVDTTNKVTPRLSVQRPLRAARNINLQAAE